MAWTLSIGGVQVEGYVRPFKTLKVTNRGYRGIGTFGARLVEQGTTPWTDMVLASSPTAFWRLGTELPAKSGYSYFIQWFRASDDSYQGQCQVAADGTFSMVGLAANTYHAYIWGWDGVYTDDFPGQFVGGINIPAGSPVIDITTYSQFVEIGVTRTLGDGADYFRATQGTAGTTITGRLRIGSLVLADISARPAVNLVDSFATAGPLTRAPTGHVYSPSTGSGGLTAESGTLWSPSPGVGYLQTNLGAKPRTFGGKVAFSGSSSSYPAAGMACYPQYQWNSAKMLHCFITRTGGTISTANPWPGTVTDILTKVWDTPLVNDGREYDWSITIDVDTVTVHWPDGTTGTATDPLVSEVTGNWVFWEPTTTATDVVVWASIFTTAEPGTVSSSPLAPVSKPVGGQPSLVGGSNEAIAVAGGSYVSGPVQTMMSDPNVFSIGMWVKPRALSTYGTLCGSGALWLFANAAGGIEVWKASTAQAVTSPNGVLANGVKAWVVYTKNGTSNHIYVNGVDQTLGGSNQTLIDTAWYDFGDYEPGPYRFDGTIDDPVIWNRTLTQTEITALYSAATNTSPYTLNILNESEISLTDDGVKQFGGYVRRRTRKDFNATGIRVWEIEGQDFNSDPSDDWVPVGTGPRTIPETDKARIEWLFSTYGTRGVLVAGQTTVQTILEGNMLDMDFQMMTLAQALDAICAVSGAQWYVDFDRKLHYFKTETSAAPFNIDVQTPNGTTTFPCRDFEYPDDTIDYVNEVQVIGKGITATRYRGGTPPSVGTRRLFILRDTNLLTVEACEKAGDAYLALENNKQNGKLTVWRPGLRAGHLIHIKNTQWGIDGDFRIAEVTPKFVDLNTAFYDISFGSNPITLGDLWSKQGGYIAEIAGVASDADAAANDTVPPAAPTNLVLTSDVGLDANGATIVRIIASLTHPSDVDYFGSYIEITRDNDGDDLAPAPVWTQPMKLLLGKESTKVAFEGVAGSAVYWGRAYAVDFTGNPSAYTSVTSVTTAKDGVAPGQPQNMLAVAGFRGVIVEWNMTGESDLMFYQLRWGTDDATWPDAANTRNSVFWVPNLTPDVLHYFQARAVDYSGNVVTSDSDATPVDYLANPDAGWTASVSAVPTLVGSSDIGAYSIRASLGHIGDLSADLITAGKLTLRPTGTTAMEVRGSSNELLGFWDPTNGITIYGSSQADYGIFDDGYLRFYKNGVMLAEMGPDGILADSIRLGALPGGHNVVLNSSFEMAAFIQGTASIVFTDSIASPGWKVANRVTSPDNITEGAALTPTTTSY